MFHLGCGQVSKHNLHRIWELQPSAKEWFHFREKSDAQGSQVIHDTIVAAVAVSVMFFFLLLPLRYDVNIFYAEALYDWVLTMHFISKLHMWWDDFKGILTGKTRSIIYLE